MADVDRFIIRFYTQHERRSSPRSVSIGAETGATREQVRAGEEWFAAAVVVMGRAERVSGPAVAPRPSDMAVLGRGVLGLSNAHRAVFMTRSCDGGLDALQSVPCDGIAPPSDADAVVSYIDWGRMCDDAGVANNGRNRAHLKASFRRARDTVAEVM